MFLSYTARLRIAFAATLTAAATLATAAQADTYVHGRLKPDGSYEPARYLNGPTAYQSDPDRLLKGGGRPVDPQAFTSTLPRYPSLVPGAALELRASPKGAGLTPAGSRPVGVPRLPEAALRD